VIQRRHPGLEIVLAPCRVQGDGAAAELAAAIRLLNELNSSRITHHASLDLILVTRGGGSLEDLWAFNEEAVARAVFESGIPVVSAVGHEIDFTICDFVADMRAATPSAAAEIITEHFVASREFVADAPRVLRQRVQQQLARQGEAFEETAARLARAHPRRKLDEALQRLDDLRAGLLRCSKAGVRERRIAWQNLAGRMIRLRPAQLIRQRREAFQLQLRRLQERATAGLRNAQSRFANLVARLRLLGPEQVLARGYSITTDEATGKILRDAEEVKHGQRLRTRLKTGEVRSVVEK
jgi:exodeoxyribonuclease VII large subunit